MATLVTRIQDLATRIATQCKSLATAQGTLASLTTTDKTSLVAAINELDDAIDDVIASAGAQIDDAETVSTVETWSINKIKVELLAVKNEILGGAGTALDTLNELATALGNDASFATTVTTALGARVRFDAAQTLTSPEKAQALTNIGAQAAAEIGTPDTNFVTTFEAGLT